MRRRLTKRAAIADRSITSAVVAHRVFDRGDAQALLPAQRSIYHRSARCRRRTSRRPRGRLARRPRTTMRYDRARVSLDRHATYIVAAYLAGAAR